MEMTTGPVTPWHEGFLHRAASVSAATVALIVLALLNPPALAAGAITYPTYPVMHRARQFALNLRKAADTGNRKQVLELLASGASASYVGFRGLVHYVRPGTEAILDLLLSRGAGAEPVSSNGQSLIYAAIAANNPAAVAILLRHHAPVDAISPGVDPLRLALLRGMTGVAIALTKAGANPDRMSSSGNAVDIAQTMLDIGYLDYLATVPPRPDAATTRSMRLGLRLLGYSREVDPAGPWTRTLTLVTEKLQRRLGLPPHGHPSLALLRAMARALQASYLNAARKGDVARLRRLQSAYPNLIAATDSEGFTALMLASLNGRANVVRFLIGSNANVNALSKNRTNAILLAVLTQARSPSRAVYTQEEDIIPTLIVANADINAKNADGVSAESVAARNPKIAQELGITPNRTPNRFYIAVMGSPSTGSAPNGFVCYNTWPSSWITSMWNKGAMITSVQRVARRWCVVMGQNVLGQVAQATRAIYDRAALLSDTRQMEKKGSTLTDFAFAVSRDRAVYTNGGGDIDGYAFVATADLRHTIKTTIFAKNFRVERIEPFGYNHWIVIYGSTMGYQAQTFREGSLQRVISTIHEQWQRGLAVTSLSHQGRKWAAVLSAGSNEQSQALIEAASYNSLKSQIKAAWNNGWHVDIITGGTLSSTGLLN